ncbi:hypothetical protein D3C79_713680 [compost metagenome]
MDTLRVLRNQAADTRQADFQVLQFVVKNLVSQGCSIRIALTDQGTVQNNGHGFGHQVLNHQASGQILILNGSAEVPADVEPLRFDDLAHDVVVVALAQAGQHLDVFGLFVSLLDGLDLALGIRHQRDHFRVIFHRHDLACDRV